MVRAAVALVALAALTACSSAPSASGTPRPNRDLITREEITAVPVTTAYEAVERLRPHFLRAARGGGTPNVYINNSHTGGIEMLRSIRADNIASIRYIDAVDANLRYGRGNDSGIIAIELVR